MIAPVPERIIPAKAGIHFKRRRRVLPETQSIPTAITWEARRLRLLFLDVVDDLGHVVLVLAEFGSVLD